MASPITLYVVPNCGLEIEFIGDNPKSVQKEARRRSYNTCSNESSYRYRIINKSDDIPLLKDKSLSLRSFTGLCSPTHDVTLPKAIKEMAGIPMEADFYASIHAPSGLANEIDWRYFMMDGHEIDEDIAKKNKWGIPCVSILGGFVYFDKDYNIIAINALSLSETAYDIQLSGPFKPSEAACTDILRFNRAHPVASKTFVELGIVATAWIRPNEKFQHQPLLTDREYKNGGMVFISDDGSAVCYVLDRSGCDPSGDVSSLADVFNLSRTKRRLANKMNFMQKFDIETPEESKEKRTAIYRIRYPTQKEDFLHELGDRRTFIHQACRVGCDKDIIESHLDDFELSNLAYRDRWFGMTALHYCVRHQPTNLPLINLLIEKCPEAIHVEDDFGRFPLHVACASDVSTEVIDALLGADPSNETVQHQTQNLGRLPLHIALYHNSQNVEDIVRLLIRADPSGKTLVKKTKIGRLALHMAVEKRLPTNVIKLLLDTNAIERYESSNHTHHAIEMTFSQMDALNGKKAIGTMYSGMLPLHIACWNNSSSKTIQLLLDADEDCTTVDMEIGADSWLIKDDEFFDDESRSNKTITYDVSKSTTLSADDSYDLEKHVDASIDKSTKVTREVPRVISLHLAATHGSKEVILLLLDKLKQKSRPIGATSVIEFKGLYDMTPIHIACRDTNDQVVIESFLSIDDFGATTHMKDKWGYTPIHYACDKEAPCKEIVQMLIQAENDYIASQRKEGIELKRTTNQFEGRNRSPLYLAGKAGAPEKVESVIELLLQPDHFYLKGFDDELITKLAKMAVKNRRIQECIIEKLSERCYFNLLFSDIYTNTCALTVFLIGTEKLLNGVAGTAEPSLLFACVAIFILRELFQIKSQSSQFFADLWNYCQVASVTLLFLSAKHMADEVGNSDPIVKKKMLIVTGGFLIAQLTFFLRATFLPFARFVGGLLMIFHTLVPFFIVSSLLLLAFTYGFRVQGQEECPTIHECYAWTLQGFFSGADDTDDFLDVLFGVIAIVVLLNVVIAIVSEAWESAQDRAMGLFWKFRLQFLSEARFFAVVDKKLFRGGLLDRFGKYIDKIGDLKFSDHTPWSKAPFNIVTSKKAYDNPFDYFGTDTAKIIKEAHSLQASLYWVRTDSERKERGTFETRLLSNVVLLNWLASAIIYFLLCILGLFTAGWVWPKNLRKQVLAVGIRNDESFAIRESK